MSRAKIDAGIHVLKTGDLRIRCDNPVLDVSFQIKVPLTRLM